MRGDGLVLACYRLAKFYGQHPDSFLSSSLARIGAHLRRTNELLAEIEKARGRDDG